MKFKSACAEEAGFEAARWGPSAGSCESEGRPCLRSTSQPLQGWEMGIVFKLKNYSQSSLLCHRSSFVLSRLLPLPPPPLLFPPFTEEEQADLGSNLGAGFY